MLPDPFTGYIDNGSGLTNSRSWARIAATGSQSDYRNIAESTAGNPRKMRISHTKVGKGLDVRDRRLLRVEAHPIVDGVENETKVCALYVVLDRPQGITDAQVDGLVKQISGILRGKGSATTGDSSPDLTQFWNRFRNGEA